MRKHTTSFYVTLLSNILFTFTSFIIFSCSSGQNILLENKLIQVELIAYKPNILVTPDSSFASDGDTLLNNNSIPYFITPACTFCGSNANFKIHLSVNDSVTLSYSDEHGNAISQLRKVFLRKGSYQVKVLQFNGPAGVYIVECEIGAIKWKKKFLIMR